MRSEPFSPELSADQVRTVLTPAGAIVNRQRSLTTKRLFDRLAASLGLILLSPVLAVIAAAVWLGDGAPVFFRQERIGRGGRPFQIWKFRSMRRNAEQLGPQITVYGDARITPVGAFLRRTKLDELPQLINVIRGEMSLVGPRPEVRRYVDTYDEHIRAVLTLTPGITDPASMMFLDEEKILAAIQDRELYYIKEIIPAKAACNLDYARSSSMLSDVRIILMTIISVAGLDRLIFSPRQ